MSSKNPSKSDNNEVHSALLKALDQPEFEAEGNLKRGTLVEGRVVEVHNDSVFVNIGQKSDGKASLSEFLEPPEIGDSVSVIIKGKETDGSEIYIVSKREADFRRGWQTIREAYDNNLPIQGMILEEVKRKGFNVRLNVDGDINLFLPASHLGVKHVKLDELKKRTLDFKIIKLYDKRKTGVISHKTLLEEVNKEYWEVILEKYKVGDRVPASVTKIASFGVFCNVEGIEGLLRQNDISYKKYAPFKQYFAVGQEIEVMILEMDPENNRLGLGIKQMFEDPWEWAGRELEKEMIVRGTVTSLTNFGAFVELKEGLEGLIHTSELSWAKKPPHPKEILKKGQEVDSIVLDIDIEQKRLSLGLKQLQPNPWDNLSSEVYVNNNLKGKITGITKYGAFVEVENGIEGLIHVGDITWDEKLKDPTSLLKKGQEVEYKILDINISGQRISCGLKQLQENPYESLRKNFPPGTIVEGTIKSVVPFGIFVEIQPGFEGLVHISQLPEGKDLNLDENYPVGGAVKAVILKIEPKSKKISLSIKDFDKALEREEMARYIKTDSSPSSESMGSFFDPSRFKSS